MAWIESHQELENHPKLLRLCNLLEIKQPQAIGHLMCLWWWCLKYAENGLLTRFEHADLSLACRFEGDPQKFVESLIKSGFVDENPLKVHDWVRYAGQWLRKKYSTSSVCFLKETWRIYGLKYGDKKASDKRAVSDKKATLTKPNLTIPNQPNQLNQPNHKDFNDIWNEYPNKDGKKAAERHFMTSVKTKEDLENIWKALNNYKASKTVKDGFVKNGSTWFNNWQDWIEFKGITPKQKELDPCDLRIIEHRKQLALNQK